MSSSEATNSCPLSQDMVELKRYYKVIKDIWADDKITNISLLRASALNEIHKKLGIVLYAQSSNMPENTASERCCFLLKLGTFYVNNVFPQVDLNSIKMQREVTHMANCMLGLKIELKHCVGTAANRNLCPISANINDFKRSFDTVKNLMYDEDKITDITLLKAKALKQIQPFEQCCFLYNLGNFYVTNVFPVLEQIVLEQHRELIHLANSVLSLNKELNECHAALRCPCGQQSHSIMKQYKKAYFKMATTKAATKAVGELDILFRWIEKNFLA
ncbi:interleukin-20-like [Dendropsophus ebraccatus]|uniref:interleukin-20-like n=1 Tax=Dendropsophus ebraccatus TaxID=150705 RepID=UPI003831DCF4